MNKRLPRIASFSVDHRTLKPGLYLSRRDWQVNTYDLRFKRPNQGDYLSGGVLHAIEHVAATYLRAGKYGEYVVYFGPMGCCTGFYLLMREEVGEKELRELLEETFAFVRDYQGDIPGASLEECGNYQDMDLEGAQKAAAVYLDVLVKSRDQGLDY